MFPQILPESRRGAGQWASLSISCEGGGAGGGERQAAKGSGGSARGGGLKWIAKWKYFRASSPVPGIHRGTGHQQLLMLLVPNGIQAQLGSLSCRITRDYPQSALAGSCAGVLQRRDACVWCKCVSKKGTDHPPGLVHCRWRPVWGRRLRETSCPRKATGHWQQGKGGLSVDV